MCEPEKRVKVVVKLELQLSTNPGTYPAAGGVHDVQYSDFRFGTDFSLPGSPNTDVPGLKL